jgi:hypothetical protein
MDRRRADVGSEVAANVISVVLHLPDGITNSRLVPRFGPVTVSTFGLDDHDPGRADQHVIDVPWPEQHVVDELPLLALVERAELLDGPALSEFTLLKVSDAAELPRHQNDEPDDRRSERSDHESSDRFSLEPRKREQRRVGQQEDADDARVLSQELALLFDGPPTKPGSSPLLACQRPTPPSIDLFHAGDRLRC